MARTILSLAVLLSLWLPAPQAMAEFQPASWLLAGAASASISPPTGTYLAGYDRDRPSTGVHDDLFVKAVVLSKDSESLAIVVIDCIGLAHEDIQRIRALAVQRIGDVALAPERIIVTSTHTHSGPDVTGLWGSYFFISGRDEAYVDTLINTAADVIAEAAGRLEPAGIRMAMQPSQIAWVENVSEPGLLDPTLSVLEIVRRDEAESTIATLTNFACHPTVLGGDNPLVSADFLGGFYQSMAARSTGEHLFLQGAIGGWVQPVQAERTFDLAAAYGDELAGAVLSMLEGTTADWFADLRFAQQSLTLPLDNFAFQMLLFFGVLERQIEDGNFTSEIAWFSIGEAQFATHPGETSPAYSLATRELMPDASVTFVLGLGLDALGYILKPEYFSEPERFPNGEYLTSVSIGPETGPILMTALEKLVAENR